MSGLGQGVLRCGLKKNRAIWEIEAAFAEKHGTQNSGFILLETGAEALNWLLTLIDEARPSLDMRYYQWYGDDSGELIFKQVLDTRLRGYDGNLATRYYSLNCHFREGGYPDKRKNSTFYEPIGFDERFNK